MQISLRSQMAAGVAALGATAVAITPIAQPDIIPSMQRVSAAVELAMFDNPVTVLLDTISATSVDLFYPGALPGPEDLYWPDSFYSEDFSILYAPAYAGLIPDTVNQFSFGALSAVLNNASGYIDAGIFGTTALLGGVAASVFNVPFALIAAAQLALAGNIPAAIAELQNQILVPLQSGVVGAIEGIGYILDNVIANASTVLTSTVPRLVNDTIGYVLGAGTYLLENVINTAGAIVTSLAGLDIEGAWNAAINGVLGYNGILGSIGQLTTGIGIPQDIDYPPVVPTIVYPSVHSVLTSNGQRLGDFRSNGEGGILNDPFVPTSAAAVAAPAAAAAPASPSAASVKDAVTDAADSAVADSEVADSAVDRPVAGDAGGAAAADVGVAEVAAETSSADVAVATSEKPAKGSAKGGATRKGGRGGGES